MSSFLLFHQKISIFAALESSFKKLQYNFCCVYLTIMTSELQLTYIFHSGFALKTEQCILIFDYWMDPARLMPQILADERPLYVFASHFHEDHYSRRIQDWRKTKENITYILSKDILRHHRAEQDAADVWMVKGQTWEDNHIKVVATGSNDSGVSWIVELKDTLLIYKDKGSYPYRIFHAGDLNNWYARFLTDDGKIPEKIISEEFGEINPLAEEKQYLGELKDIRRILNEKATPRTEVQDFDLVMFPVDGRIGNGYTRGGRQFIDRFTVGQFVPMHFVASGFESSWRFKEFANEKDIPFWEITKEGDVKNLYPTFWHKK